jgi:tRNA (guanine37-N1)-methyltransferase
LKVPEVLLSGHHAAIRQWRKRQALERTLDQRPDLLAVAALDDEEREMLTELKARRAQRAPSGKEGGHDGRSGNN